MSIAACRYALAILESDPSISGGERKVLGPLAMRANHETHETYTGAWLCAAAGMNEQNMRRNVRALVARGIIAADHRKGLASVVRFPLGAAIAAAPPAGRLDDGGAFHPSFCACPDCLAEAAEA